MTELEQRRRSVQTALAGPLRADALLVSSPANLRYLTGYAGSNGLALVTPAETHFFTDPRYALEASQNITCKVHIAKTALMEAVAAIVKRKKLKKIGFEPAWLNLDQHQKAEESAALGRIAPAGSRDCGKPPDDQVAGRRSIRSARACWLNSEAYARTLRRVRLGMRERDMAAELDYQMRHLRRRKVGLRHDCRRGRAHRASACLSPPAAGWRKTIYC